MRWDKKQIRMTTTVFLTCVFSFTGVFSQTVIRSRGIGLRGGFWKAKDGPPGTVWNQASSQLSVDLSDVSGSIFFLTRLTENLFFETNLSGLGQFVVDTDYVNASVEFSLLIPFLMGCRYDLLPSNVMTPFQPYVGSGFGPYVLTEHFMGENNTVTRSDIAFGLYGCLGLNVMIRHWIAVNCDIRYHFVNFHRDRDYSGLQFCTGLVFMWGGQRDVFSIEDTKVMVRDVYPAYYAFYNTYPLALVTVKNIVNIPIEVKIISEVTGFSEHPYESEPIQISPGKAKDIPIYAQFGPKLIRTMKQKEASISLEVEAKSGAGQKEVFHNLIMIHNRNAWDGDVNKLGFFITPDGDGVLATIRRVTSQIPKSGDDEYRLFLIAKNLFDELMKIGIQHVRNPLIPFDQDDRVQYAMETEAQKTGDCDDLVVLYSSLLQGVGVNTAFIDVKDSERNIEHVYMMFDTGLPPEKGALITQNDKRYVIRERPSGDRTLWIPVETTLVEEGFGAAWEAGALHYLQAGLLRNGLSEGWLKIVDVE